MRVCGCGGEREKSACVPAMEAFALDKRHKATGHGSKRQVA